MQVPQLPIGGSTQKQILMLLQSIKDGMTVDKLVDHFGISRTAVNQHLTALERDGYVKVGALQRSGGRPRKLYVLTDEGANLFPKKYSWFSALLMQLLESELGAERLGDRLRAMGISMAQDALARVDGARPADRVSQVVEIMNETGFDARVTDSQGDEVIPRIECKNCVYHDLARDYPQVCEFDLGFLSTLMRLKIEHQDCMMRGGRSCRFRFLPETTRAAAERPKRAKKRKTRVTAKT